MKLPKEEISYKDILLKVYKEAKQKNKETAPNLIVIGNPKLIEELLEHIGKDNLETDTKHELINFVHNDIKIPLISENVFDEDEGLFTIDLNATEEQWSDIVKN